MPLDTDRKWRRPKQIERKAVLGTSDSLGRFMQLGSGATATTPTSALSLYRQSSAVSVPINKIADPFSVMGLALQIGDEVILDHPVLDLLKNPSPFHTQEQFLEWIAKYYLITGEYIVIALGNPDRPPLQIIPMNPAVATPVRENVDAPKMWQVSGNTLTGNYTATPGLDVPKFKYLHQQMRELKQVRNFSTRDNSLLRGESLLVSASREAQQHILGTQHNVSLLENGGRVTLAFHFEEDMEEDDFKAIEDKLNAKIAGPTRAGQVFATSGGKLKIEELGTKPRDMDFQDMNAIAVKAVANQYSVPIPLITDNAQTFNNYHTAILALYDDAVLPIGKKLLSGLSDMLLPRYNLDPSEAQIIANQETVTALVSRRNEELLTRSKISIESPNELRAQIGREPFEGGDAVYQSAGLIPVGTDLFTADNAPGRIEPALGGVDDE